MPSQKVLVKKKEEVQVLAEKIQKAVSGILVDYRGLTVEQDTDLRTKLRDANVDYKVVKNTLTRFAVKGTNYEDLDPYLHGPTSMALTYEDPIAAAKVLSSYAKSNEKLEIKAGFVDGKVIDLKGVKMLADLPSREELIAKALGGLNAPISGFVNVLNANLRGLAVALNAIAEKKAQEA